MVVVTGARRQAPTVVEEVLRHLQRCGRRDPRPHVLQLRVEISRHEDYGYIIWR